MMRSGIPGPSSNRSLAAALAVEGTADPAQEPASRGAVRPQVRIENHAHRAARDRIQRFDRARELAPELALRGRTERGRTSEQPEQLVDIAQDQKYVVALAIGELATGEQPRRTLPGAVAVVRGAPAEAAHGELIVDRAAAIRPEVVTRDPGGLAEGEVVGCIERTPDAAQRGAAAAVGHEIGHGIGQAIGHEIESAHRSSLAHGRATAHAAQEPASAQMWEVEK